MGLVKRVCQSLEVEVPARINVHRARFIARTTSDDTRNSSLRPTREREHLLDGDRDLRT